MDKRKWIYLEIALALETVIFFVAGKFLWFTPVLESLLMYSVCAFFAVSGMDLSVRLGKRAGQESPTVKRPYLTVTRCFGLWSCLCAAAGVLLEKFRPGSQYIRGGTVLFICLVHACILYDAVTAVLNIGKKDK